MADKEHIGIFIDGSTYYATSSQGASETFEKESFLEAFRAIESRFHAPATVALPPEKLITKFFTIPSTEPDIISDSIRLQMETFAPTSGDDLEVSYEIISQENDATSVIAVAVPMATLDEISQAASASGLSITRIDSTSLALLHTFLEQNPSIPTSSAILFASQSGRYDLTILANKKPILIRTLGTDPGSIPREFCLSLADIPSTPTQIIIASESLPDFSATLTTLTNIPTTHIPFNCTTNPSIRDKTPNVLNLIPNIWYERDRASARHGQFLTIVCAAFTIWLVFILAYIFAPKIIEKRIKSINVATSKIAPSYQSVADVRTKVRIIRAYGDRSLSLLEILRELSQKMPESVTFSSISYDKGGTIAEDGKTIAGNFKISGIAPDSQSILDFKDLLDDSDIFSQAKLTGPSRDAKNNRYRFELDTRLNNGEQEQ